MQFIENFITLTIVVLKKTSTQLPSLFCIITLFSKGRCLDYRTALSQKKALLIFLQLLMKNKKKCVSSSS